MYVLKTRCLFLIAVSLVLSSCVSNRSNVKVTSAQDLKSARFFFVIKQNEDERGINVLIQDRLIERGYKAATGPRIRNPEKYDVVVTYIDKWAWDITMYMIELTITFRDVESSYPIAVGNSLHGSLTRLSSEEMVKEVLDNIFKEASS